MPKILLITICIIASSISSFAYWPVTLEENMVIAAEPDTMLEVAPSSIPYYNNSTLVVYKCYHMNYQIIDQYGEFMFEENQRLTPDEDALGIIPHLIPDGFGGAFVAWACGYGVVAQHLDSLGNRLWGDDGSVIFPIYGQDFDIFADGDGGLYLAMTTYEFDYGDVYLQHIDSAGEPLWPDPGVAVANTSLTGEDEPILTQDGQGGCYVIWDDHRPPYGAYGALFAQRYDSNGDQLWWSDIFICERVTFHQVIPDSESGFILHANANQSNYNTVFRIDPGGNILWEHDHVSWTTGAQIVVGEPGFFYLGFSYGNGIYAQRMDIEGNQYWPVWPGSYGATVIVAPNLVPSGSRYYTFNYPYFFAALGMRVDPSYIKYLVTQCLDTSGNRQFGNSGYPLTFYDFTSGGSFQYINAHQNAGGVVCTFEVSCGFIHDIYAKRVNFYGMLGGPNAPIDSVTISISENDIVLTWPEMAPNAEYHIYKSSEAYSFPAEPDTVIADTVFIDSNAILNGHHYYNVTWQP